jgi:dolichol-phosphate mannosyltransferase
MNRQHDGGKGPLELTVVIPTLNERDNIEPMVTRLDAVLGPIRWEAVFVDDDSTDGTAALIRAISLRDQRIRVLHRIGRRGLASACLEGMLSSAAPFLAVVDADGQHDESLLPRMLERIKSEELDLVVASRNIEGGGMGQFAARRVRLSELGTQLSRLVVRSAELTDPMSGFFVLRRDYLHRVVYRTSGIGFKILLDLVASSSEPVKLAELPYQFGVRRRGESKLDISVALEYFYLLIDKLLGGYIPVRFVVFVLAGLPGLVVHLAALAVLLQGWDFARANIAAIGLAMTLNFFVNNWITFRDARLKGASIAAGLLLFYAACAVGALASFALAQFLYERNVPWYLAGVAGMAVASVWNFGVSQVLAWRRLRVRQPYG